MGPPRNDMGPPRNDMGPPRNDMGPPRNDVGPLVRNQTWEWRVLSRTRHIIPAARG
jgi:hypothetical protein